ncbi:uroporphyrinogen-III synthase [Helicobacter sp. MIT 14-3879]|uniref:uroporphyrinogen-III synthase n=1 Tax=Helicobacter sp. MIT 14-3879 TaxID=2040649 RepID=UPI000E1EE778|nr:uroporphyrinogen-III synthase [Helicobacter sp. MIT 14-3879]RDU63951.1 uroporphyrinogen-III synthase [Helicobacter sp. MIT 14-3879]
MREIFLIGSKAEENIKSLVVSEIKLLPFEMNLSNIDALIFTSRYAIKSISENAKRLNDYSWKDIPSFVIGKGSATYLERLGGKIEYVGQDSHGDGFAKEIIPLLKNRHPLYIHAKKIVSHINEKLLHNKIKLSEVIAYENKTKKLDSRLAPPPNSILIFTAPSHYKAFLANFKWDGSYLAIAIGMTTFGVFDAGIDSFVAPEQSIQSCIKFAKEIALRLP